MIAQIAVFSRKTDAQQRKNFRFVPQKLHKSLRMETLVAAKKVEAGCCCPMNGAMKYYPPPPRDSLNNLNVIITSNDVKKRILCCFCTAWIPSLRLICIWA